jgi:hypothetical protein
MPVLVSVSAGVTLYRLNLFTVPYVMIRQDVAEGQNLSFPAVTSRKDVRTLVCREHTHAHAHTHTRESERERENERERVREMLQRTSMKGDASENKHERLDSDNEINISRFISVLGVHS